MQTEQFDDEFRKKLLDINPVTYEDEVDRIHNYISSKGKITPDFAWSKLLLYGLVALLLISSLTFNYVQNLTTQQLFSSLDSLKNRVSSIDNKRSEKIRVRVDTIYLNRYIENNLSPGIKQESRSSQQSTPGVPDKNTYFEPADLPGISSIKNNLTPPFTSSDAGQSSENERLLLPELNPIVQTEPTFTDLQLPALKQPEKAINGSKNKLKYYSPSIKSILKNMDYYLGGSFDAGDTQIGGSLLGELRITPKWSFQTGLRWSQVNGDTYYTAEQFAQKTGTDFRTLYAPYVAQNVDLLNIEQNYQLAQIPLVLAYHHEISPNWALRFGLGTDLSAYTQKHIHFDYKENNLSFDQGEYNTRLAIKPINNLTINLGLERRLNKFVFRVSPYITPQLRKVEYARESLFWGARVQLLYRIK